MKKPTIFFIHGAFVTPKSWEPMKKYFTAQGFECLAPAWPHHDKTVEELRQNPAAKLGELGLDELVDHYAKIIKALPEKPVLIGHSFGGLLTQLLMDRELGVAGIAIDSAGSKGVLAAAYPSTTKAIFGIIASPWRKTYMMPFRNFQYAFVHTLPRDEQERAYKEHVIPETTRIFFQAALAPFISKSPTAINYNNGKRGPLLMIAGQSDRIVPESMVRKNHSLYNQNSGAVTEYKAFPYRVHWIIAEPGFEEIADYSISWLNKHLNFQ
ncbi:alpha/beta fold hydrolase [Paenibacillus psychroresistens]|uniref:Alpha/beta fold hydrolase n=1 Tax=Paenibacillus psychroresistens TaxID=1778678 RepID=A0A6B8RPH8_9BACL|nr:alpha/beta fold hydrolase [Paenibacillus psychroresistens]QGQ97714.1 alpha/beta fold hydrolase [Paenibacillus psychroresistens]